MNSTPSSASLIFALRLRPGLAHVFGHQAGAVGLDEVALLENAHRAEDLAEDAGDGRLAGAGIAGEDHVQAHVGVGQARPRRGAFAASDIGERADFVLDAVEPDQLVELGERFLQVDGCA